MCNKPALQFAFVYCATKGTFHTHTDLLDRNLRMRNGLTVSENSSASCSWLESAPQCVPAFFLVAAAISTTVYVSWTSMRQCRSRRHQSMSRGAHMHVGGTQAYCLLADQRAAPACGSHDTAMLVRRRPVELVVAPLSGTPRSLLANHPCQTASSLPLLSRLSLWRG